jgi:hypothetical protein
MGWQYKRDIPKYVYMDDVAARYVRRYRTLAVHRRVLMRRIVDKWGYSKPFIDTFNIPAIGYLTVHPLSGRIVCEALAEDTAVIDSAKVAAVARAEGYRNEKLKTWAKKNHDPDPELFTSWVIQTELEGLLKGKENARRYNY